MSDEDDLEEEEREEVEEIVNTGNVELRRRYGSDATDRFFEADSHNSNLSLLFMRHVHRCLILLVRSRHRMEEDLKCRKVPQTTPRIPNGLSSRRFDFYPHTFDWLDEFNEKSKIELDSLIPSRFNEFDEDEDDDNLSTFRDALMYWRYPMETLPSTVVRSAAQSEMYVTKMSSTFTKNKPIRCRPP